MNRKKKDYLTGKKKRVKINSSFSSYLDIFIGVSQGSILGPLLFNLFLCDLLFIEEANIMSCTDDNTPYVCSENVDVTLKKLEEVGKVLLEWFSNNFLKENADKCHLILSTDEHKVIKNSNNKNLLVIKYLLPSEQQIACLARISQFMNIHKRRMTMNGFIASEFGYCPLVWMFHSRKLNSRVNELHERELRIVYQGYASSFTKSP